MLLALVTSASAQPADNTIALPDDPRLSPVRPALEKIVAELTHDGLPAHPIVDKVQEGLAKGIAPDAIRDAAVARGRYLLEANRLLRTYRPDDAPFPLVLALARARGADLAWAALTPLMESDVPVAIITRSVETLTDLSARGYPESEAAAVVLTVASREPNALDRLLAGLEAIRNRRGLPARTALEQLGQQLATDHDSFETVVTRVADAPPEPARPRKATKGKKRRRGSSSP
jgi:hypothetical protein